MSWESLIVVLNEGSVLTIAETPANNHGIYLACQAVCIITGINPGHFPTRLQPGSDYLGVHIEKGLIALPMYSNDF
jgi:hypothetical protein